jgi:hypothetical protein
VAVVESAGREGDRVGVEGVDLQALVGIGQPRAIEALADVGAFAHRDEALGGVEHQLLATQPQAPGPGRGQVDEQHLGVQAVAIGDGRGLVLVDVAV